MQIITRDPEIRSRLARDNYALIKGNQLLISPDLRDAQQQFLADWSQLEPDTFLKKGSHFRFRRFNYFYFSPENKQIKPFPPMDYCQSTEHNRYAGGDSTNLPPID